MGKGAPRANSGMVRAAESWLPLPPLFMESLYFRETAVLPRCFQEKPQLPYDLFVTCYAESLAAYLRLLLQTEYGSNTGMAVVLVGGPYVKFCGPQPSDVKCTY
jgi:hypothetical protein